MMSEIRINKVQTNIHHKTAKEEKTAEEQKDLTKKPEVNHKPASDVLDYMAKSALPLNIKTKKVDVSKHVDSASAARIEKMMQAFEETILNSAEAFIEEFGLSEEAATDAAIIGFNRKYLV